MPKPFERRRTQHLGTVAATAPADGDPGFAASTREAPFVAPWQGSGAEAIVSGDVVRRLRRAVRVEIGRRGTEHEPGGREPSDNEGRAIEHTDPDGQVQPLIDEVHVLRAHGDVDGEVRIALQEGGTAGATCIQPKLLGAERRMVTGSRTGPGRE
jgi:hypothetical protein